LRLPSSQLSSSVSKPSPQPGGAGVFGLQGELSAVGSHMVKTGPVPPVSITMSGPLLEPAVLGFAPVLVRPTLLPPAGLHAHTSATTPKHG
jgi:hypothetical protein